MVWFRTHISRLNKRLFSNNHSDAAYVEHVLCCSVIIGIKQLLRIRLAVEVEAFLPTYMIHYKNFTFLIIIFLYCNDYKYIIKIQQRWTFWHIRLVSKKLHLILFNHCQFIIHYLCTFHKSLFKSIVVSLI